MDGVGTVGGPTNGVGEVEGPNNGVGTVEGPTNGFGVVEGPTNGFGVVEGPTNGFETVDGRGEVEGPESGIGEVEGPTSGNGEVEGPMNGMREVDGPMDGWIDKHIETITKDQPEMTQRDQCPSTPTKPPPGSLLCEMARPPSPTSISDFPFYELKGGVDRMKFAISPSTEHRVPRFKANKMELNKITRNVDLADETQFNWDQFDEEDYSIPASVETYTVIADMGTYGRTFRINKTKPNRGELADSGANCSMTPNISALRNITKLRHPIIIGLAITDDGTKTSSSECTHIGDLPVVVDDGTTFTTKCFYNPHATDTIISPQAIIDESNEFVEWKQVGRKFGQPGQLHFVRGDDSKVTVTLHQRDGLYFINSESIPIHHNSYHAPNFEQLSANKIDMSKQTSTSKLKPRQPKRTKKFNPTSKAKVLESETWYLRMGACSEDQLKALSDKAIGIPLNFEWHPF